MIQDPLQSMRIILLVEDSEEDFEAITRALKKAGLDNPVFWCKSGDDALAFLKRQSGNSGAHGLSLPGLILLDLNMPGLDGHHTLQMIKEDATLKRIPVIVLTTSSNERDVGGCYQTGASGYIQKPSNFEDMVRVAEGIRNYWFETVLLPPEGRRP